MDEKQKQEMKEKAMAVAKETTQKAKKLGKTAAAKADELYNKLPLDKINEKLGGKIDVKSSGFKKILSIVVVLLLVIVYMSCTGGGEEKQFLRKASSIASKIEKKKKALTALGNKIEGMVKKLKEKEPGILAQIKKDMEEEPVRERFLKNEQYQNERLLLKLLQTNKKLYEQYQRAVNVATRGGDWVRNAGLTPQEYVDFIKKKSPDAFNPASGLAYQIAGVSIDWKYEESKLKSDIETHSEYYFDQRRTAKMAELYKDVTPLQQKYANLKAEINKMIGEKLLAERQATWKAVHERLEREVPQIINEKLDESFDTCQKVTVNKKPSYYEYTEGSADEKWNGIATIYNSRTGKTKQRMVYITYAVNTMKNGQVMIIAQLSNDRP